MVFSDQVRQTRTEEHTQQEVVEGADHRLDSSTLARARSSASCWRRSIHSRRASVVIFVRALVGRRLCAVSATSGLTRTKRSWDLEWDIGRSQYQLYPLRPNLTGCNGRGVVSERRHRVSERGDDTMTRDEKIIRNKVGVLELAKQLGSEQGLPDHGIFPRQLLPVQGALRQGW